MNTRRISKALEVDLGTIAQVPGGPRIAMAFGQRFLVVATALYLLGCLSIMVIPVQREERVLR